MSKKILTTESSELQSENKSARLAAMCMIVAAVSFGGFCVESIFVAITENYIDNRNMVLPFILGYGLAMAAIYTVFGIPTRPRLFKLRINCKRKTINILYYFVAVFICVSIGECFVGMFVETVCDVTWWDYSKIPFSFTKFTSVPTSTGFTSLIMVFTQFFFEPLYKMFMRINKKALNTMAIALMLLLFADCIYSGIRMYLTNDFMILWRIEW